MSTQPKVSLRKAKTKKFKVYFYTTLLILSAFYIVAFSTTSFSVSGSSASPLETLRRIFIVPLTDMDYIVQFPVYIGFMMETIFIAYAGVTVATILAIPVGFLAARNMTKRFSYFGKALLNGIRAVPELIFAIIFVAAVGIGPYAGVLAISINSIGMLGKLYAEVIESIDTSNVDAIKASGGNRIQAMWYGVLPQVLPEFSSYSIYRFEIDVRASTVLGIVGAGGIGAPLILATYQRNWEDVGMILIVVVVFVSIIDLISGKIRKKLV
ncbi:phosphonate ABC transporter, permease protein PhnE [Salipaludibacillus keqinensis]|uniref:Phosphonate ABC transporter, permease protein PhnE n=1 Tax=Salipaludibacillus keqinensis TaxID=2045207 RepID=A0A323TAR9_9BACI|nr:phosphonate ABC transporter, permease protein PhnE [Salipaludibacillus keqinensis]PYZ92036.1 phosphonate ABC transporter, permease protein PhnE [Salipaludibacillus keqinensis]